jgi:hypothetical protein
MFTSNSANSAAGLAVYGNANVSLDGCTLQNNRAMSNGAGLEVGEFAQVLHLKCTATRRQASVCWGCIVQWQPAVDAAAPMSTYAQIIGVYMKPVAGVALNMSLLNLFSCRCCCCCFAAGCVAQLHSVWPASG